MIAISASELAIVAAAVFAWGMLSSRMARFDVTAPILFVLAGLLLTHGPVSPLSITPSQELIKGLTEATLVLVLFCDASRIKPAELRPDLGLYVRLLGLGLPLTMGLGTLLALALIEDLDIWLALLVGAALAPTDAALGAGMMLNRSVPARIRRLINVESGLNDGIATPFVFVALAGAGHHSGSGPGHAILELLVGLAIGVASGGTGGWVLELAARRGWIAEIFAGPAVLGLAVCAYASALALEGNGFIAAFTAGLAFSAAAGSRAQPLVPFVEETGSLLSLLVWLVFGAVVVEPAVTGITWQIALYAVLSLTVIRLLPVALALTGAGMSWRTVAFIGWFGPRGLASVVFALIALEELGEDMAEPAVSVIAITVMLSVIAHGASAEPLAQRYGPVLQSPGNDGHTSESPEILTRRTTHRPWGSRGRQQS